MVYLSLGHDVGDMLLIEVSECIQEALIFSDSNFRLGGDEFSIILKNIAKDVDAGIVAEKLIRTASNPYEIYDQSSVS